MERKPRRSGLMIRLVDVVFILLFGFIAIAQVDNKRVELPRSEKAEDEAKMSFSLTVTEREVDYKGDTHPLPPLALEGRRRHQAILALRNWIKKHHDAYVKQPGAASHEPVQIRPERRSMMQWTIDVYDACRSAGLDAAIVVEPVSGR